MNRRRTAPGRVLVVAFLAATGLVAYAAPGLAAEAGPTPPLTAVAAAPTGDDPDDEPSGGGWRGTREAEDGGGEDDFAEEDSRDEDEDGYDSAGSSDADERYVVDGEQKSSKAKSTKITTKKKKDSKQAAKKKAAKKKAAKKAAEKKAKQQAAARKKMRRQALKAARAAQKREQQQRRATADDGDSGGSIDSMRQAILDLTNRARASAGCGRLRYSNQLERSAQSHANDMADHNYMSHTSRSGKNSDQRIRATGFNGDKTGENLANGFSSPEAVVKAWMNSPSHRRNIVDCKFKILGVGYVRSGGYWVQHFGG